MKDKLTKFQQFAVDAHANTNHYYDGELPYSFHLRMAAQVAEQFKETWVEVVPERYKSFLICLEATYGHDLIEDTRVSYNDLSKVLDSSYIPSAVSFIAEIIFAVSNNKGRNRSERANESYYKDIRKTPGAVFIKLCDRIANVKYGAMMKSRMLEKYKEENDHFLKSLGLVDTNAEDSPFERLTEEGARYFDMIEELKFYLQ